MTQTARAERTPPHRRADGSAGRSPRRLRGWWGGQSAAAGLAITPWAVGFLLLVVLPIALAIYWSFTKYNLLTAPQWVGLDNYRQLLGDPVFLESVRNTLFLAVVGVVAGTVMGLGSAVLVNQPGRITRSLRSMIFLPVVVPPVATAIGFIFILNPQYGALNWVLGWFGIAPIGWLDDPQYAKYGLLLMVLWGAIGQIMVTFLAALQEIPSELVEAAKVDGAGPVRAFRHVTLPLLSPVILYAVVISTLFYFQFFEQAFVVSPIDLGAPANSTMTYSLYIYQQAFTYLHMGVAAAMSCILLVVSGLVTGAFFWLNKRVGYEQ